MTFLGTVFQCALALWSETRPLKWGQKRPESRFRIKMVAQDFCLAGSNDF